MTPWQSWAPIFQWQHLPDIPKDGIIFAKGVRLEILPEWVRSEEATKHLHASQRSEIKKYIKYGFRLDYEAASLGDPDPIIKVRNPVQNRIKPSNFSIWQT